ncbi:5-oxoprolinase subunit B family protein [Demequina flava]|uniref:5-oxoprolinase subunit B family protein n=1 Tax=Demequina flava TaxID=1095025 RepID=UPI0007815616|nr:allophanate hydrolase subunit 1 [Demequina flava]
MKAQVRPLGSRAVIAEVDDSAVVPDLAERLRDARSEGEFAAVEIVPAARTVMVSGLDRADRETVASLVSSWDLSAHEVATGPIVNLAVDFDGPDLADVASVWNMSAAEAVDTISSTHFEVAFCGFAPGFAYLSGLGEGRAVPRRSEPRTSVPAGSVGLAGPYAGVYPRSSPGGWQIVGTVRDAVLWDVDRTPPALLEPGTRVRFVP